MAEAYDPLTDAAERWPGWRLELTDLRGMREIIFPDEKLILLDPAGWDQGARHGLAHSLAHLDLGHHLPETPCLTDDHEAFADTLAAIRLDREGTR